MGNDATAPRDGELRQVAGDVAFDGGIHQAVHAQAAHEPPDRRHADQGVGPNGDVLQHGDPRRNGAVLAHVSTAAGGEDQRGVKGQRVDGRGAGRLAAHGLLPGDVALIAPHERRRDGGGPIQQGRLSAPRRQVDQQDPDQYTAHDADGRHGRGHALRSLPVREVHITERVAQRARGAVTADESHAQLDAEVVIELMGISGQQMHREARGKLEHGRPREMKNRGKTFLMNPCGTPCCVPCTRSPRGTPATMGTISTPGSME